MANRDVPKLRSVEFPDQWNTRVRKETKDQIKRLKREHNVDVATHFRKIIETEVQRLLAEFDRAS